MDRRARVLALLAAYGPGLDLLCAACVAHLPSVRGAGLAVMTVLPARGTRFVSDVVSARLEDLQFELGEGPCVDAFESGRPVLTADMGVRECRLRWPVFADRAVDAGVRAVFAFPLQIGAIRVGVLDLYRDTAGPLPEGELADALVFADAATLILLAEDRGDHAEIWPSDLDHHAVVHQASGMVMVQLGSTIDEALARLRAYAFAHSIALNEVAADVVARRLAF